MACWLYEGILLFDGGVRGRLAVQYARGRCAIQWMPAAPSCKLFCSSVFGVYFSWFWAKGQTLAMKTWNIRVVDREGRPLTQWRALLRYVCSWLWFLPPLALIAPFKLGGAQDLVLVLGWVAVWAVLSRFHPQRQFWHDALAGTRLIPSAPLSR